MHSFLPFLTLAFGAGIAFAAKAQPAFIPSYLISAILLVLCFVFSRSRRLSGIFIFCFVFSSGAAMLVNADKPAQDIITAHIYKGSGPHILKGVVLNKPVSSGSQTKFLFRVQEVQFNHLRHTCSGNILVRLAYAADLDYGQELLLCGNVYRSRFCGPGACALMNVKSPAQVIKLGNQKGAKLKMLAFRLKEKSEQQIRRYSSGLPAAIVEAMVLGEKKNIPFPVYDSMVKSGTVHILVVSGFNTSIIAGMIVLILKILRLPRRPRIFIAGFLLVIYCLMAGASTPVVRATIMALVFMSAYLFKRDPDIYNSLALAAIFILAVNPRQLFDIGFQLSFVSVFSIVYLYPRLSAFLHTQALKNRLLKLTADGALVSFSAWLGTVGFIAHYFKIVSPITVFANLIIVPLSSLITLCGLSVVIAAGICPQLAGLFASSAKLPILILFSVNSWLIRLPGAYFYLPGRS